MAQLWKNYLYLIVNVTSTYQAQLSSHETENLLYTQLPLFMMQ